MDTNDNNNNNGSPDPEKKTTGELLSYIGASLLCTAITVWCMVYDHIWILTIVLLFFIFLNLWYFSAFSFKMGCSALFFIILGLIIFAWIKEEIDSKYGIVYVLGNVSQRQTTYTPSHRKIRAHNTFEAVFTAPAFGISGLDSVKCDFLDSEEDLEKPFPIKGSKVLLRYAIAMPQESVECEAKNPSIEQYSKYKTPVVVTPEGSELEGADAMEYIEDCKRRGQ